jgi:hypothetical protein
LQELTTDIPLDENVMPAEPWHYNCYMQTVKNQAYQLVFTATNETAFLQGAPTALADACTAYNLAQFFVDGPDALHNPTITCVFQDTEYFLKLEDVAVKNGKFCKTTGAGASMVITRKTLKEGNLYAAASIAIGKHLLLQDVLMESDNPFPGLFDEEENEVKPEYCYLLNFATYGSPKDFRTTNTDTWIRGIEDRLETDTIYDFHKRQDEIDAEMSYLKSLGADWGGVWIDCYESYRSYTFLKLINCRWYDTKPITFLG